MATTKTTKISPNSSGKTTKTSISPTENPTPNFNYGLSELMRRFIFLTSEGDTRDPEGREIENLQVLGLSRGINANDAFENFKRDNSYILGFSFSEVSVLELASERKSIFLCRKKPERSEGGASLDLAFLVWSIYRLKNP